MGARPRTPTGHDPTRRPPPPPYALQVALHLPAGVRWQGGVCIESWDEGDDCLDMFR